MEGAFNKIISYEEGLIIFSSWGASPMSHENDAARSVLAALNIKSAIYKFTSREYGDSGYEYPVHIGIATGNTFIGIVGNEGSRREAVILGEPVEKALLMMQTATKHFGRIYVDVETRNEAAIYIEFEFKEHIEFTHKLVNDPIFEPIEGGYTGGGGDHTTSLNTTTIKGSDPVRGIRIHGNPFVVDFNNEYQNTNSWSYGNIDILNQILEDIVKYTS